MLQKHILLVGDTHILEPFLGPLRAEGIAITVIPQVRSVLEKTKLLHPTAIVFVLPRYWDDITVFVDEIRKDAEFEQTPILYVGSLIEGEDQHILQQKGVKTLTLGPLPPQEVVRYLLDMMK